MSGELVAAMVLAAFAVGLVAGKAGEAQSWRRKADGYFRKESGGRLYVVARDPGPSGPLGDECNRAVESSHLGWRQ